MWRSLVLIEVIFRLVVISYCCLFPSLTLSSIDDLLLHACHQRLISELRLIASLQKINRRRRQCSAEKRCICETSMILRFIQQSIFIVIYNLFHFFHPFYFIFCLPIFISRRSTRVDWTPAAKEEIFGEWMCHIWQMKKNSSEECFMMGSREQLSKRNESARKKIFIKLNSFWFIAVEVGCPWWESL